MVNKIKVSVVYALPEVQRVFELTVDEGSTVRQVIELSPVLDFYPEIDINSVKTGIFSDLVPLTRRVKHQERVEIYRPLIADHLYYP